MPRSQATPTQFFVVNVLGSAFPVPGAPAALSTAAGAMFGLKLGLLLYVASTTVGGIIALLIGRLLLKPVILSALSSKKDKIKALDIAITKDGLQVVGLLRLSPAFPFAVTTVMLALTSVSQLAHAVATLVALVPSSLPFVYAGAMGADAASGDWSTTDYAGAGGGLAATALVTWKIAGIASQVLETGEPKAN